MARRVLIGCRDCVKCNAPKVVKGFRNVVRGTVAVATAGGSELGMAVTGTCGTCGHQRSLHESEREKTRVLREEQKKVADERRARQAIVKTKPSGLSTPEETKNYLSEIDAMIARSKAKQGEETDRAEVVEAQSDTNTFEKGARPISSSLPPAGFYNDPESDSATLRWWDGSQWTEFTKAKE